MNTAGGITSFLGRWESFCGLGTITPLLQQVSITYHKRFNGYTLRVWVSFSISGEGASYLTGKTRAVIASWKDQDMLAPPTADIA